MKLLTALSFLVLIATEAPARKARTIYMNDKKMEPISVGLGRSTILSFPMKPNKVIFGNQGLFAVEYVDNDLAIAALRPGAHSNLFVYVEGRRFGFDLATSGGAGDEIVLIRDTVDKAIKLRGKR